jgi:hypothetical protein
MDDSLKEEMRDRGYLGIQSIVANSFYKCRMLNKLPHEDVKKLFKEIRDCVKAAWQLGHHEERMNNNTKQICQMQAQELEIKDSQLRQIVDILENIMQEIDDKRIKSEESGETVLLFNQWKGLNRFRGELDKIMEGEG